MKITLVNPGYENVEFKATSSNAADLKKEFYRDLMGKISQPLDDYNRLQAVEVMEITLFETPNKEYIAIPWQEDCWQEHDDTDYCGEVMSQSSLVEYTEERNYIYLESASIF